MWVRKWASLALNWHNSGRQSDARRTNIVVTLVYSDVDSVPPRLRACRPTGSAHSPVHRLRHGPADAENLERDQRSLYRSRTLGSTLFLARPGELRAKWDRPLPDGRLSGGTMDLNRSSQRIGRLESVDPVAHGSVRAREPGPARQAARCSDPLARCSAQLAAGCIRTRRAKSRRAQPAD
jgi:hypothetical protein